MSSDKTVRIPRLMLSEISRAAHILSMSCRNERITNILGTIGTVTEVYNQGSSSHSFMTEIAEEGMTTLCLLCSMAFEEYHADLVCGANYVTAKDFDPDLAKEQYECMMDLLCCIRRKFEE